LTKRKGKDDREKKSRAAGSQPERTRLSPPKERTRNTMSQLGTLARENQTAERRLYTHAGSPHGKKRALRTRKNQLKGSPLVQGRQAKELLGTPPERVR